VEAARVLHLAHALPRVGDTVTILALHGASSVQNPLRGPRRHPARVAVSHDSAFVYVYLGSSAADLTSGAAVLDRQGQVVGINVGTLTMSASSWQSFRDRYGPCCEGATSGERVGLAVNVQSIRRRVPGL